MAAAGGPAEGEKWPQEQQMGIEPGS